MKLEYTTVVIHIIDTFAALIHTAPLTVIIVSVIDVFNKIVGTFILMTVKATRKETIAAGDTFPTLSIDVTLRS